VEVGIVAGIEQGPANFWIAAPRVGSHGINTVNLVARIKEAFAKTSAYKTGTAGDQYFFHGVGKL
jgi:hypothetical protein